MWLGMPLTTKRGNSTKTIKDNMKSDRNTITKELTNEFTSHINDNDTGCYSINAI